MVHCERGLECKLTQAQTDHNIKLTSVHKESNIKFMKNATILLSSKKNQIGLVTCGRLQVTLLARNILHGVYSTFDTLFPSLLSTLAIPKQSALIGQFLYSWRVSFQYFMISDNWIWFNLPFLQRKL